MRIFVAVELAPTSREAIGGFVFVLRRHTVFSAASVKWVSASNLHITFLGEVPASRLAIG
jgi:2'-5' RNA ligase